MESEDKLRRIQQRYLEYKQVVLQWESAFMKTEGREPKKADMEQAPRNVRTSYQGYQKYKTVLSKRAEKDKNKRDQQRKNSLSTTPQKIFNASSSKVNSFTLNASQRTFLQKRKTKPEKLGRSLESSFTNADSSLNISTFSSANDPEDSPVNTSKLEDSVSFDSVNISGTQFDSDNEDVPVPDKLYTNFAADVCDTSSFISSLSHDDGSQFSSTSTKELFTNVEHVTPNYDVTASHDQLEMDTIAEEVRQCFSILNGVPEDNFASDDSYFPQASFVLASSVVPVATKIAETSVVQESSKSVQYNGSPQDTGFPDCSDSSLTVLEPVQVAICKSGKENVESPCKRKFAFALSPSPEKEPKKKIFKSDRRSVRKVSLKSCRPDIPDVDTTPKTQRFPQSPNPGRCAVVIPQTTKSSDAVVEDPGETIGGRPSAASSSVRSKTKGTVENKQVGTKSKAKTSKAVAGARKLLEAVNDDDEPPVTSSSLIPVVDAFDVATNKEPRRKKVGAPKQTKARKKKGINDNYVSIDIKKKVFVRRKKAMTGAKYKRLEYKHKQTLASRASRLKSITCHKCGDIGHYSKFCQKGKSVTEDTVTVNEAIDDSPWPTLEEAARMAWSKSALEAEKTRTVVFGTTEGAAPEISSIPEDSQGSNATLSQTSANFFTLANPNAKTTEPYISEDSENHIEGSIDDDVYRALRVFGYEKFRPGQKEAVTRVLRGESTLLMLSTGSGKSLCYQLPAYMYSKKYPGTMTICVSPLVSLMEDQVEGMPSFLNGVCLHYNMTEKKKTDAVERIRNKEVQILLVSPEALCGGLFGLFRNTESLPPIGFACIDEVHCVSEWSHNFRPSYLQVCKILREKLNIRTILGLTATATAQTCVSICEQLKIHPSTIIRGEIVPKNLKLSVSRDMQRDEALIRLLYGDRFRECESIIIYCTRREECNRIAELVRTHIQTNPKFNTVSKGRGRSQISSNCEAYHAGLTAARRSTIQKQFMQGNIRIVVATIAFGMGIDKSDIRAVIHYNMPSTFESYVQEIGRAGRDGLEANCHLFLDNVKGRDISELKRHIYANSVDRVTVRKLIHRIFKTCVCKNVEKLSRSSSSQANGRCSGHEVSFSVSQTVQDLDLPEENIETLLCHLEVDKDRKWIELLPKTYELCKIHSYGGPQLLKANALKCPPLAVAIALQKEKKRFKDGDAYLEFNVVEAAASVGWNSAVVRKELKSLEWSGSEFNAQGKPTKFRKSGLIVEFSELAYRCIAPGDLSDKEFDDVLNSLCDYISSHERRELFQLHRVYQALSSVSASAVQSVSDTFNEESSLSLKEFINEYFQQDSAGVPPSWKPTQLGTEKEEEIRREVRNLLVNYKDTKFTGRAVAKIFQGISSPNFPATDWCRNRAFWRRFLDVDFHFISKIASEEIIAYT